MTIRNRAIIMYLSGDTTAVYKATSRLCDKWGIPYCRVIVGSLSVKKNSIAGLGDGDKVYIVGHGSPTTLGGETPNGIAFALKRAGLRSGVIVSLVSCNTGTTDNSFAHLLKTELASTFEVDCQVVGRKGLATVSKSGSVFTKTNLGWRSDKAVSKVYVGFRMPTYREVGQMIKNL